MKANLNPKQVNKGLLWVLGEELKPYAKKKKNNGPLWVRELLAPS